MHKSLWLLFPIRCNYHEQPHSKAPLAKDEHPREVNSLRVTPRVVEIVSASWNKIFHDIQNTEVWHPTKTTIYMGKNTPTGSVLGGWKKIRPWSKNHQPFKGSIVRSQERSDPGIGALAALFEVRKSLELEKFSFSVGLGKIPRSLCWKH